jgi:hypothetical protein
MKATITNTTIGAGTKGGNLRLLPVSSKPGFAPPQPIVLEPGETAEIATSANIQRWIVEEG